MRRVALGVALARDLSAADVLRLRKLALIEDRDDDHLRLTALGKERYEHLHETIGGAFDNAIDGGSKVAARSLQIFDRDM